MAIHDWSRVSAGIFHAFLIGWITQLSRVLNSGVLPEEYYCLVELLSAEPFPTILPPADLMNQKPQFLPPGGVAW
jgi:hypothetical protein